MPPTTYRDLARLGLPFVIPGDARFESLVEDVRSRSSFWPREEPELDRAAILLNQAGKAIITLAVIWKYAKPDGTTRDHRVLNLGSSMQLDVLAGRAEAAADRHSFILPGSKRLITPEGVFGDNSDVLPLERHQGGGMVVAGSSGRPVGESGAEAAELVLDSAIFEDGLCVGPDESKLFETVRSEVDAQRAIASELAAAMQAGASAGQLFERLRPLARHGTPPQAAGLLPSMTPTFAHTAIHMLIDHPDTEVLK